MSRTSPSRRMSIFDPGPECNSTECSPLPVVRTVRETTTEFGYLLRHYWMSATALRYAFTVRQRQADGAQVRESWTVTRRPVQVDADVCLWREICDCPGGYDRKAIRFSPIPDGVELHEYDRSRQTYRAWPVTSFRPETESEYEARNRALLRQPILPPLLPIPLGFQWYVHNDEGHLNFTLESVESLHGRLILSVRRSGLLTLDGYYRDAYAVRHRFDVRREGLTVYDLDASTILEDNTCDQICTGGRRSQIDGVEIRTTMKLLRSRRGE